ncbi:MAG: hypothetical protein JZD40_03580 [Sulfolobus sp.]|nr:hypothetical protein [Sulfolobus sp.]
MVKYTSSSTLSSGLPLGGIGAGKIELSPENKMINVTIANNWNSPIREVIGYHIFIKPEDDIPFFFQKNIRIRSVNTIDTQLEYEGIYPFVMITGRHKNINVTLEAFSPIIYKDVKDSSLPAVAFKITIKGSKSGLLAFSMSNLSGTRNIGRMNSKLKDGVFHINSKVKEIDPAMGNTTLISDSTESVIAQYNIRRRPSETVKFWGEVYENEKPWIDLVNGKIPEDDIHEVTGMNDEPASIVIARYEENKPVKFVFAWYFTGKHVYYPYGHYYQNFFKDSEEVARYFMENFDKFESKSKEWQETIIPKYLPDWLRDAIVNSTYIMSTNTWLDEKGRFSILEGSINCPCHGTIGTCYDLGSLPVIKMWPELEKSFLETFLNYIRDDGYVPHDLGVYSLDDPTDGTTAPPKWKDLNPTFLLMIYRYIKFTGDKDFLDNYYPKLLKILDWILKQDKDNDGLPELEGEMDTAFDALRVKGIDSYTSSIFIASLEAMRELAKLQGDIETVSKVNEFLIKARNSFNKLYNGRYFKAWLGEPDVSNAVFTAQVFGEWWASLLGLEHITDVDKIRSSLETIAKINGNASNYCTPNLVSEDGKILDISGQTYSSWPRLVFALSWLGYKQYGIKEWLDLAKKEWDNLVRLGKVWDQPSRINGHTGNADPPIGYLDHYIGSSSLWSYVF